MKLHIKQILASSLVMLGATTVSAQDLNSAYFTDGYLYRYQMNPAMGNDSVGYVSMPMAGNVNVLMHGNFGLENIMFETPANNYGATKKMTTFMHPGIAASDVLGSLNSTNELLSEFKVGILSAGWKGWGGYNTMALNLRGNMGVSLPYELFEFAKNTGNKTYNIGDINMTAQSFMELSLGHSHQINEKLRIGANLKLLFGIARMDFDMKDVKADLNPNGNWTVSGDATANVSVKGFKYVQDEEKEYKYRPGTYRYVNDVDIDGTGLNGFGLGIDLGATYKINEDITVSAALLDLGFISWSNNMLATNGINGKKGVEFNGFRDLDVHSGEGKVTIDDRLDDYSDQLADFTSLQDKGDQGGRTTGIGATMNFGVQYTLPMYRQLSFGLLSNSRFHGNYSWTEARLSANWAPLKWLDGGMSLGVNTYCTSAGWIVNIHPKGLHLFVGMDHILGKTSKEMIPLTSNASLNLGLNIAF